MVFCLSSRLCLGQARFEVWGTWGESVPLGAVAEGVNTGRAARGRAVGDLQGLAHRMAPLGETQCGKDPATVLGSAGDSWARSGGEGTAKPVERAPFLYRLSPACEMQTGY